MLIFTLQEIRNDEGWNKDIYPDSMTMYIETSISY